MSATATSADSASTAAGFGPSAFERFLDGLDEPQWVSERRRAAFHRFLETPMPSLRDEEWRRTDIRAFKLDAFAPPRSVPPSPESQTALQPCWDALAANYGAGLARIDGATVRETAAKAGLPQGVVFCDLNQAAREHSDLLTRYLGQAVSSSADAFSELQAAYWSGGAFLYVPKGVKVETPLFHLVGLATQGRADFSRTLVVVEDGAEATLVQESVGLGDPNAPALHCGSVELFVGEKARLRFVNVQNWSLGTWCFSRERAVIARDADLQWTIGALGSRLTKANQDVALAGPKARAQVNGVMFASGRQHLAYFTRQDHQAPNTASDLLYKGGLKDKSRIVWKGMIRVDKDAQKTDAYQKNDNLVLSEQARADSIPGLEIEANDVRCTHGATAGRVDEDMIFYALSRGVSRETAIRLIVEGFFANVYDRVALEPAQDTLRDAVSAKLDR